MATVHQLVMPVRLGRDHLRGLRSAPVTLLEYGDYECPHCGVAHAFVEDVRHRLDDDLRFAFRHFPLRAIHPKAERVAEALYAARVREDYLSGLESGVTRRPTLFINNVRHVGAYDADSLLEAIEAVRRLATGPLPGSGVRTQ